MWYASGTRLGGRRRQAPSTTTTSATRSPTTALTWHRTGQVVHRLRRAGGVRDRATVRREGRRPLPHVVLVPRRCVPHRLRRVGRRARPGSARTPRPGSTSSEERLGLGDDRVSVRRSSTVGTWYMLYNGNGYGATGIGLGRGSRRMSRRVALTIPFNRPYATGAEFDYIREAIANSHVSGNGPFTRRCTELLERELGSARVLLTHSCTGALEMAALLADIGPGDEVIIPSFAFPSIANAVALRGATSRLRRRPRRHAEPRRTPGRGGDHARGRRRSHRSTTPAWAAT